MADARLTHPTRSTLPFHQRQQDDDETSAVLDITSEIGTRRKPLVHAKTRERTEPIRGLVTGNRRARNDPNTSDPRQALANYADLLESHADDFQGLGYTYEDDLLDESLNGILTSVQWSLSPGDPETLAYETGFTVGRGTLDAKPINRRNPTYDTSMSTMLRVDGIDLPGMRDYQVQTSIDIETNANIKGGNNAENNDLVIPEGGGRQTTVVFEGTLTGSASSRNTTDDNLRALVPTDTPITLETKFPGYNLEGFVTGYTSRQRADMGEERHDYRLEFVEGIKS